MAQGLIAVAGVSPGDAGILLQSGYLRSRMPSKIELLRAMSRAAYHADASVLRDAFLGSNRKSKKNSPFGLSANGLEGKSISKLGDRKRTAVGLAGVLL